MSNERSTRQRKRRSVSLSPAELEWLTGEEYSKANRFARLRFIYPTEPEDFDHLEDTLQRAAGAIDDARLVVLRSEVDALRAEHRRTYPRHAAYAATGS